MNPTLSFIILTYKSPHHLRICLTHLQKLKLPFPTECIVVDNASHDDTSSMMRSHFPDIRFIENASNVGHPHGNNIGFRASVGTYVLFLNPDIIIRHSSDIQNMIEYMEHHPHAGILGPKLLNPDNSIQASCYRPYSLLTPFYRRTPAGRLPWGRKDIERHLMKDFDHRSTRDVTWLLGAALCMRRSMLETIGLFDEDFFLYFGDYEMCDRARGHGWGVQYFHNMKGFVHYHKRESAPTKFFVKQFFAYATRQHLRDWFSYLRKHSSS